MTTPLHTRDEFIEKKLEEFEKEFDGIDCHLRNYEFSIQDWIQAALLAAVTHGRDEAAQLVETWHYKKGGYTELAEQIRSL